MYYRFYSNFDLVPEGFELVEKTDHKKKRLESEKKELETWIEYNRKQVMSTEEKLNNVNIKLKEL